MTPRFLDCFARVIGHEGGYVNDPRDPGGETKFGISKRAYPKLNIRALTLERAQAIYWSDYWLACRCDSLPKDCDGLVFDAAVNHGPSVALRLLQAALGVAQDGNFGPISAAALRVAAGRPDRLEGRFVAHRLLFWASLSTWPTFGRGWTIRGANELLAALED